MKNTRTATQNTPTEKARATFPHLLKAIEKELKNYTAKNPTEKDRYTKYYNGQLATLEHVATAPTVTAVKIAVEWKKSQMWGHNPHTTAETWTTDENGATGYTETKGRASGCGYDKQSASIASALNENSALLKLLYIAEEKRLKGKETRDKARRDVIGYGSGYGALPYFEGGCGVSCFYTIFKNCGFTFEQVASGKTFDVYTIKPTPKTKKQITYINGIKATQKDLERLEADEKSGKATTTEHTTKKGARAIVTNN